MSLYLTTFLAALAGSMHCIGMCGGFACLVGGSGGAWRPLAYNAGRVTTYIFLGAVLGLVGGGVAASLGGSATLLQGVLALFAGAVMVGVGLEFLGVGRRLRIPDGGLGEALVRPFATLLKTPHPGAPLAFGVANGLLPCPLVYAFAAQALAAADPVRGAGVMAALGLGTLPAMLAAGGIGRWLRPRPAHPAARPVTFAPAGAGRSGTRVRVLRLAGGLIIVLGVATALRSLLPAGGMVP